MSVRWIFRELGELARFGKFWARVSKHQTYRDGLGLIALTALGRQRSAIGSRRPLGQFAVVIRPRGPNEWPNAPCWIGSPASPKGPLNNGRKDHATALDRTAGVDFEAFIRSPRWNSGGRLLGVRAGRIQKGNLFDEERSLPGPSPSWAATHQRRLPKGIRCLVFSRFCK